MLSLILIGIYWDVPTLFLPLVISRSKWSTLIQNLKGPFTPPVLSALSLHWDVGYRDCMWLFEAFCLDSHVDNCSHFRCWVEGESSASLAPWTSFWESRSQSPLFSNFSHLALSISSLRGSRSGLGLTVSFSAIPWCPSSCLLPVLSSLFPISAFS